METFPMNDTGEPSRIGARRIDAMGSLTEALVDTLLSAYDDAGDSAHDAACRLLFDNWACRLGGDRALPVDWQPAMAARHAAAACQLDRDDVHWASMTHPGSIIWPTVLDVGLRTDADGAAVLRGAILGYEVCARLAEALGPSHRRGWHATATAGTVGAAMSAAVLLGLDRPGIITALGHAISVAGGSSRAIVERSATKVFHRAHAVSTGIACAEASSLFPATREGLEIPHGMLATMSSAAEPDRLIEAPRPWAVDGTAIRLHAVSGFAHTAVEAAAKLAVSQDPSAITAVHLVVSAPTKALAAIAAPVNDDEAWWSVQHAVATCLVHGDPAVLEAGLQDDPRVHALLARTTLTDGAQGIGATVTVERADGSSQAATVELPMGHPERRASREQLLAKWAALTGGDGERAWAAANHAGSRRLRDTVREAGLV
jgi:2-methylcitrate dehydratase PrpD